MPKQHVISYVISRPAVPVSRSWWSQFDKEALDRLQTIHCSQHFIALSSVYTSDTYCTCLLSPIVHRPRSISDGLIAQDGACVSNRYCTKVMCLYSCRKCCHDGAVLVSFSCLTLRDVSHCNVYSRQFTCSVQSTCRTHVLIHCYPSLTICIFLVVNVSFLSNMIGIIL